MTRLRHFFAVRLGRHICRVRRTYSSDAIKSKISQQIPVENSGVCVCYTGENDRLRIVDILGFNVQENFAVAATT